MGYLYHIFIIIFSIIILLGSLYAMYAVHPVHRPFLCNDPRYSLPIKPSIISATLVYIWALFLPIIIMYISEFFLRQKGFLSRTIEALTGTFYMYYFYFIDFAILHIIMASVKLFTGSYRPNFFEVCKPDALLNCTSNTYVLDFECTNTEPFHALYAYNESFFSGHSMFIAYSCTFCILYLQFRFHSKSKNSSKFTTFWLPFIQSVLISLGFFGCISRFVDNHHHAIDILVGAGVGILGCIRVFYTHVHYLLKYKDSDDDESTDDIDLKNEDGSNEQFL